MERIIVGNPSAPLFAFDNADLIDCSCVLTSSLSGDELAIDQFMPVIYSASYIRVGFVPVGSTGLITSDNAKFVVFPGTGYVDKIPYGSEIRYYNNDNLIGKFYTQRVIRSGKAKFDILAVSAVGVLDGQQHNGGIYTGETFADVATEIIGNQFSFTCSDDVADINVYGWLPIGTKRANLHQLLFATGVGLYKDSNGDMVFRFPNVSQVKNIPDNRIFYGGDINFNSPASGAEVTEHTFEALPIDDSVTLFDNTQAGTELADHAFIAFADAPVHDLTASGLTIHESGVNYAIVSGVGTLVGKKYTHITKIVSDNVANFDGSEKIVSVTDATLVSVANSNNVLKRVLSYYSSARTVRNSIVLTDELPGDQLSFNNPWNEPEQGFLNNLEINASSFLRANAEMITGYYPSGGGNNYTRSVVLSGSGVWVAPITGKIRIALIGGGTGGSGGKAGGAADGWYAANSISIPRSAHWDYIDSEGNYTENAERIADGVRNFVVDGGENPGLGGLAGANGEGGKILVLSIDVVAGQSYVFNCGIGGIGGVGEIVSTTRADGEYLNSTTGNSHTKEWSVSAASDGEQGTDTTFGIYSSADGTRQSYGYMDVIGGNTYGMVGSDGTDGSSGSRGGSVSNYPHYNTSYTNITDEMWQAVNVERGQGQHGGLGGHGQWRRARASASGTDTWKRYAASGSGTAGAAYGSAAPSGRNFVEGELEETELATLCAGVRGASALALPQTSVFGQGGAGGNGGGGGSCSGSVWTELRSSVWAGLAVARFGGLGGDGSEGQRGGDGCIVINY